MVWETVLPAVGAAVPLTAYALKKDRKALKDLEVSYSNFLNCKDLTTNALEHYKQELGQFKGGVMTFLKKREYASKLDEMILLKEIGKVSKKIDEISSSVEAHTQSTLNSLKD